MTPDDLSRMCRCGHAGRFHREDNIGVHCQGWHTPSSPGVPKEYHGIGCYHFEPDNSYVLMFRDTKGRFHAVKSEVGA